MDDLSRQYDGIAAHYRDGGPYNALFERPAMLSLLGDVHGRDVLDAGCGSGLLAEALVTRGARVTCVDSSESMLDLARGRLGDRSIIRLHDLQQALDWAPEGSFDLVVSSLAMHYIGD
jgi:2-polyprenyl-3-methyl-5-hydroxy-6-metoxy-1,4-benzoquinol methylase